MKKLSFLKIALYSGVTVVSGLLRFKVIVDLGAPELLGLVATALSLSTLLATSSFGNLWSVAFLHGQGIYKEVISAVLFRPLMKICKQFSIFGIPVLCVSTLFFADSFLIDSFLVMSMVTSQVAVFSTVAYLRGLNLELFLSRVTMINNLLTTLTVFLAPATSWGHIILVSALFNFLQWGIVVFSYRKAITIRDAIKYSSEYEQMELQAKQSALAPIAPIFFDVYWRVLLVLGSSWTDIGLIQPAIQFLLVIEPMLIHLALALGGKPIRDGLLTGKVRGKLYLHYVILIAGPFAVSSLIALSSSYYLTFFFGNEFIKYESYFQIVLFTSILRFALYTINLVYQRDLLALETKRVMLVSLVLRITTVTIFLYSFGVIGVPLAIALESVLTFAVALLRIRKVTQK